MREYMQQMELYRERREHRLGERRRTVQRMQVRQEGRGIERSRETARGQIGEETATERQDREIDSAPRRGARGKAWALRALARKRECGSGRE